jgi:hypothetical protein
MNLPNYAFHRIVNAPGELCVARKGIGRLMRYNQSLDKVHESLSWLNANARHAIELQETFTFPAYDRSIRESIKGTDKVRCYKICMVALYFEFIMALMRMYDSYERDTASFKTLFGYLSNDFIHRFEARTQRKVKSEIQSALNEYKKLKGSHFWGRLKTVRDNMFAHTSTNFNRRQIAEYGHTEKLLAKTLPMLNSLNLAIRGRTEPFDKIGAYWKAFAIEFWQDTINSGQ